MKRRTMLAAGGAMLLMTKLARAAEAAPYKAKAGRHAVDLLRDDWNDAARERVVPVKIYAPKGTTKPSPVVVFSHGLGGSREGYEYLGRHWASHGYVSVHLQHAGSDAALLAGGGGMQALRRAVADPQASIQRPLDVRFVMDRLTELNAAEGDWKDRFELSRAGIAGHSFGGFTTLAVAGQTFTLPLVGGRQLNDPRFRAAIAMSAPVPARKKPADLKAAFGTIRVPTLHMTGTLDDSPVGDTKAAERRLLFDAMESAEQQLVIFNGGDHMVYSGRGAGGFLQRQIPGFGGDRELDELFQGLVKQISTAWWDAMLLEQSEARTWLDSQLPAVMGERGTTETKRPARAAAGAGRS